MPAVIPLPRHVYDLSCSLPGPALLATHGHQGEVSLVTCACLSVHLWQEKKLKISVKAFYALCSIFLDNLIPN